MALILNIETTTDNCSVSLARDGNLTGIKEQREGRLHAALLTSFIEELMNEANLAFTELDAVSISKGPGSYTGLRIGVSAAKGICYAIDIPLIAVHTLQAMTNQVVHDLDAFRLDYPANTLRLIPMIDARRMEVYSAVFDTDNNFVSDVQAEVLHENLYDELLNAYKGVFFGSGSEKFQELVHHKNSLFLKDIIPTSKSMISLSEERFREKDFEDVAYFEPFYLKEFITTIPRKKLR